MNRAASETRPRVSELMDGHSPLTAAYMLLMNSETPCIINMAPVTGMTVLKG